MKWRHVILVLVCCALSFGGSFTCKSTSDSDKFTEAPKTPAK